MSVKIPDQRGSTLKCSLNRVISCRVCALKAWSLLTCLKVNRTIYHFLICHLHRSPMIRLSHKLPINSQKVADKSVAKLLKSCYFIFKVAQKFIFFYLFALEFGFIAVFTAGICLDFSFSSYFSEIFAQPFSFRNRINRAFICTFFSAGI